MFRLYDRNNAPRPGSLGLSCDEDGLLLGGAFELITAEVQGDVRCYRVRPLAEINKILSAGFGEAIDVSDRMPALRRILDLLQAGAWGAAQVAALQLRLPELPDQAAVDRLLKADRLLRFNPNHKSPGPGGGQFTSGSDSGSGAVAAPKLSYRTTGGAPNTPFWGTEFSLSYPSAAGGYVVQEIATRYETTTGVMVEDPPFWEAFQVFPGDTHTRFAGTGAIGGGDDVWTGEIGYPGSHGVQIDVGTARFYEGLTTKQLQAHGFEASGAGSITGSHLLSVDKDPKLPTDQASNAVVRVSRNRY